MATQPSTHESPFAPLTPPGALTQEESYRTLFQQASDAMWVHDMDSGAMLDLNEAAVEFFGYSAEEQKAMGIEGLIVPESGCTMERAWEYARRAIAGEPQRFEWCGRHKDGTVVWHEVWQRRVSINGVGRLLVTGRDISDRRAAEEALRQSHAELERRVAERTAELAATNAALAQEIAERRDAERALAEREAHFRRLIENASDQVLICDTTGAITYIGPSVERLLGFTPEEMMGMRPPDNMHPDDLAHVSESIGYLIAHPGEVTTTSYRTRHKDGSWRVHEAMARTLSPDSADAGIVCNIRDITDRVEAERALAEREAHFRRIIETTSDYVMTCNAANELTYVSPSATALLGYTPEQMMGARPGALIHPDDVPTVTHDLVWLSEHPGESVRTEYRIRHADGSWRVFESVGRTIASNSVDEGIIAIARDVTDRKRAESAMRQASAEAEQAREDAERANRAKSDFLSRMSHELRTPMNSILGFAQLLARADIAGPQQKSVQHILKAGRHLLRLINEVLEISRIEAGRENFSLEPVSLPSVLQEAFGLVRPLAQQWQVELREGAWPAAFVQADRQRLVQVLLNLLSNAIKYNRPGGAVNVHLRVGPNGDRWTVRVEDDGRGIPADRVEQLFTPFARLGAEGTEIEGTGLGLALSQRLCEAMGGGLRLESTSVEGSVFLVELAAAVDPCRVLDDTGVFAVVSAPHRAATLLYVEDNLANLSLVETILLLRPGWRTIPALQGQLGVTLAREYVPDVILLDLHLPDISGEEVLRRLRADERTMRIPVVVVSADATTGSVERLKAAGADAYLTKPLDVDEFLAVVERFLPVVGG